MLMLARRIRESLYLYPEHDVDPAMSVGELFACGPIEVLLCGVHTSNQAWVGIAAPMALTVVREELEGATSSV